MAAGKDQTQPVVLYPFVIELGLLDGRIDPPQDRDKRGIEFCPPTETVDGPESPGRHKPGTRVGGRSIHGPAIDRRGKRILHGFLGEVEIAEQADQRSEDAA
jgi:hypothetical protein